MSYRLLRREFPEWKLTDYEEQRTPHPVQDEADAYAEIAAADVGKLFKCAVCLNLLENTMTMKECLHRFCNDCIEKSLRLGRKECPTCRTSCPSRRSLRHDARIDGIIHALYPDRQEYERMQDQLIERVQSSSNFKALAESIKTGMKLQAEHRRRRLKPAASDSKANTDDESDGGQEQESNGSDGLESDGQEGASSDELANSSSATRSSRRSSRTRAQPAAKKARARSTRMRRGSNAQNPGSAPASVANEAGLSGDKMIEFELQPVDNEEELRINRPFIRCHGDTTMLHVCHFVSLKVNTDPPLTPQQVTIYMQSAKGLIIQGPKKSLKRAAAQFKFHNGEDEPMLLLYRVDAHSS